jgi:hypothetical protein
MKNTFKNPYYFTLLITTIALMLIFYSYNIFEQPFSCHIKFFIYNYISLSLLFLFYNSFLEEDILIKHGLKKNSSRILDEINNNFDNNNNININL